MWLRNQRRYAEENEDGLGEGEVVLMMMKMMSGMVVRVNVNFEKRGVI